MKHYRNSDRAQEIDEKVHSEIGRRALKMKYIDGKTLMQISEELGMAYSTFTDNYYKRWLPELFADFDASE
jgi:hypothetical protein